MKIFQNDYLFIEVEKSEIPWLKIFSNEPYKELSFAPKEVKEEIWRVLDVVEKEMIDFFSPTKINIASFGNYVPHLHFHIMARFSNDSFFPEPMWGKRQREGSYKLEDFEIFLDKLKKVL